MAVVGYARVSTKDQDLRIQKEALEKAGCEVVFAEKKSGKNTDRPELNKLLSVIRDGDKVIVYKLDRLGRSMKDLVDLVDQFKKRNVEFVSLKDSIDTSTPMGRFTFNIFASIAEFEREMIRERTSEGLKAAKARGVKIGREKGSRNKETTKRMRTIKQMAGAGISPTEIASALGISRMTCYRYLNQY